MTWYQYLACVFAGMFLANVVPHFVQGISGNRFPTPFAHPPGRGLSAPIVNTVWALANFVVGFILFRVGQISKGDDRALAVFFTGIAIISTCTECAFREKTVRIEPHHASSLNSTRPPR